MFLKRLFCKHNNITFSNDKYICNQCGKTIRRKLMIYKTYFKLTHEVNDFEEAKRYLEEDNMTKYLNDDVPKSLTGVISSIKWNLTDIDSGNITFEANRELTNEELNWVSNWVSGQNSDGLGEGFEQQDFANYKVGEYDGFSGDYDEYYEDDWVMASFDWQTNDYKFERIN